MERPILITLLAALTIIFIITLFQKKQNLIVNGFTVIVFSLTASIVAAQLLILSGIVADETNSSGDPQSFYITLIIGAVSLINPAIYFLKT
ncbi:hypothetical protein [Halobacillus sp. A5]|uniref:hypothetical protein n=1 Tax=Halobacillus sp. A5 TaxID=2880263 RepID=UPI0020A6B9A1|nr:hypothetical protein [Halobacillus sp. A5]MCP3028500.1 hypothetical protein [Halobacillus sp. A5]